MCDRCEELEEKVRQLTELLGVTEDPPRYGLKPSQWILFQIIARRGLASHRLLYDAYTMLRPEPIQPDTVKVMIHQMNQVLPQHGLRLTSIYGWGYKLEKIGNGHHGRRAPVAASRGGRAALLA